MPHVHRWNYFYVPGDGYRYCACGATETVDPDGKTGPVPAGSEAFVRRKIEQLEKKAYVVPGSLQARVEALIEKRAALPPQLTHALVGAPIGAALGAGVQYARNYDNPDADARLRAVGKGAFGGGVLGVLGGALHGQLQHEGAALATNQASVAARERAAEVLEKRQRALDAVGARPHSDYRGGQMEINTAGDYHVDAVRKMSDGEFEAFLRQKAEELPPEILHQRRREQASRDLLRDMPQEAYDAMYHKRASAAYGLLGAPVGAALGAGAGYLTHRDATEAERRHAMLTGGFFGGVLGTGVGLGVAMGHQHPEVVAANDRLAAAQATLQKTREDSAKINAQLNAQLAAAKARRVQLGAQVDATIAATDARIKNTFGMTQAEFDAKLLDPNHVWTF